MNKYCEETSSPAVANKLAIMKNDFEIRNKVHLVDEKAFRVDEEIINKEDFLSEVKSQSMNRSINSNSDYT